MLLGWQDHTEVLQYVWTLIFPFFYLFYLYLHVENRYDEKSGMEMFTEMCLKVF